MTISTRTTGERLREEDLTVGKAWVHPDTHLEYEDFHAWFCGRDPLPHWRNARIKEVWAQQGLQRKDLHIDAYERGFERDGSPVYARRTDEFGLSLAHA